MTSRQRITVDGNEAVASVAYRASEVIAIYPITPCVRWGSLRRVGEPEEAEPLGRGSRARGDAVRRRRGRRGARRAAGRRARDHLHGVAGPAADDPEHVQDRRRADAVRDARGGAHARHARAVDLRRPLATSWPAARPASRCCARLGAGGARPRRRSRTRRRSSRACRSCISSTASAPRTRSRRSRSSSDDDLRALIDETSIVAHRARALTPDRPVLRGTAQNPDVFFQAREAANRFYRRLPGHRRSATMDRFAELTGRALPALRVRTAHPEAERVIVLMGSGAETVHETVDWLVARGEKVGVLKVRLYRPFSRRATSSRRCRDRAQPSRCSIAPRSRARSASRSTRTS